MTQTNRGTEIPITIQGLTIAQHEAFVRDFNKKFNKYGISIEIKRDA